MGGVCETKTIFLSERMSLEKKVLHSGLKLIEVEFISSWDLKVLKKNYFLKHCLSTWNNPMYMQSKVNEVELRK